ncbi:MAG: hypothetical protein AAGF60_16465, partial [Pseudomonadota bacterium]
MTRLWREGRARLWRHAIGCAVALCLTAMPAAAQAPWELPRDDWTNAELDAVFKVRECLEVQYSSFGNYQSCNDVVFAGCQSYTKLAFGARNCLDHSYRTWRAILHSIVADKGWVGGKEDVLGVTIAQEAHAEWEVWMGTHCTFGLSSVHPYMDDRGDQRTACRTELAAAQAIRLWAT